MSDKTYYEVLGVTRSATEGEVKAAWRELARKLHPDVPGGDASKFAEVSAAYAVLRSPKNRRAYDLHQTLLRRPCLACNGKGTISKQKGFIGRVLSVCNVCNGSGFA